MSATRETGNGAEQSFSIMGQLGTRGADHGDGRTQHDDSRPSGAADGDGEERLRDGDGEELLPRQGSGGERKADRGGSGGDPAGAAGGADHGAPVAHADPRAFFLALAEQMAASVGDTAADVFRRPKSGCWMLGQAKRAFPGRDVDELRSALLELQRDRARPFEPRRTEQLTSRRPLVFLEASMFPCWEARAQDLAALVEKPVTTPGLFAIASERLGWKPNQIKNGLAAAENAGLVHWHRGALLAGDEREPGRWAREPAEDQGAAVLGAALGQVRAGGVVNTAESAPTAVRIGGAPPRPRPPNEKHPWRTKPMSQSTVPSTDKPAAKLNGAGASTSAASAPTASAPSNGAVAASKPTPSAKELERRAKVSQTMKATAKRKREAAAAPAGDLDQVLEEALEPVLRRAVGRVIGKLLKEAIGGEAR